MKPRFVFVLPLIVCAQLAISDAASRSVGNIIEGDSSSPAQSKPREKAPLPPTAARALWLYSITDLGDFPGGQDHSQANAINASGQVVGVGQNSSRNRAFLTSFQSDGAVALVDLGSLDTLPSTGANGINAFGQVVGTSSDGDKSRAFLWNPTTSNGASGSMLEIQGLPGERNHTNAVSINARGQVVGSSVGRAFLWTPSIPNGTTGTAIDLGGLPGGTDTSFAFGLNDLGQVVGASAATAGVHAFVWTPAIANGNAGSMIDLGVLSGGAASQAFAINKFGAVVGQSDTATGQHAFLWRQRPMDPLTGSMIDLGALAGGNNLSSAFGINAGNEVVGHSNSADGDHPFLWTLENGMIDLNTSLDESGSSWRLFYARSINDAGQIVGWGAFDPDGPGPIAAATHAFRLDRVAQLVAGQLYQSTGSANELVLRFVALSGATYQLEALFAPGDRWRAVGSPIVGTGGIVTIRKAQTEAKFSWRISRVR